MNTAFAPIALTPRALGRGSSLDSLLQQTTLMLMTVTLTVNLKLNVIHCIRTSSPCVRRILALSKSITHKRTVFRVGYTIYRKVRTANRIKPALIDVSSRHAGIDLVGRIVDNRAPPVPRFRPSPRTVTSLLNCLRDLWRFNGPSKDDINVPCPPGATTAVDPINHPSFE